MLCHPACVQQPSLQQHVWPLRGSAGWWAQLHLCWLPYSAVLWASLPACGMAPAQACVQGAYGCGSSTGCWKWQLTFQVTLPWPLGEHAVACWQLSCEFL